MSTQKTYNPRMGILEPHLRAMQQLVPTAPLQPASRQLRLHTQSAQQLFSQRPSPGRRGICRAITDDWDACTNVPPAAGRAAECCQEALADCMSFYEATSLMPLLERATAFFQYDREDIWALVNSATTQFPVAFFTVSWLPDNAVTLYTYARDNRLAEEFEDVCEMDREPSRADTYRMTVILYSGYLSSRDFARTHGPVQMRLRRQDGVEWSLPYQFTYTGTQVDAEDGSVFYHNFSAPSIPFESTRSAMGP